MLTLTSQDLHSEGRVLVPGLHVQAKEPSGNRVLKVGDLGRQVVVRLRNLKKEARSNLYTVAVTVPAEDLPDYLFSVASLLQN